MSGVPKSVVAVLAIVVAVLLIVVLAAVAARLTVSRMSGLARFADARGWTYTPSDPTALSDLSGTHFSHRHPLDRALDVLAGVHRGRPCRVFAYESSHQDGLGSPITRYTTV